ncbi:MAG: HD domain-containing protein [Coriobacteriaceae bacterium]|nr:HD domain-containing protein [Coriobacteriaceae bacterium]
MPRVEAIWSHPLYQRELARINAAEEDRFFCRHDVAHLLDAARVGWIRVLEEGLDLPRDLVYAAALLHDIGRGAQYDGGGAHEIAGELLATSILADLPAGERFDERERASILAAVRGHRDPAAAEDLSRVIAWADKVSRPCFACPAVGACKWTEEKKNLEVRI